MKETDRVRVPSDGESCIKHDDIATFANILHVCSKETYESLDEAGSEAWNEDIGAFIVSDPERPEKKLHVYFNSLDETMLNEDDKAINRGISQAVMDLLSQVSEMKGETLTEIKRVCSIWICKDQGAPNEVNGTISSFRLDDIKLTESSDFTAEEKGHILVYVIHLWNFEPDVICQSPKDELMVTLRQLYDVLI